MRLRTFDTDIAPLPVREHLIYSLGMCENHVLAKQHVVVFSTLLDHWQATFAQFLALQDKISRAEARIDACDDTLDVFVDDVADALLYGNNDRTSAEFRSFFGSKQPHEIKRPILGEELETVRAWISALKNSPKPLLVELGARGEVLVANADQAVTALGLAQQEFRTFRLTGGYSQFIDAVNTGRKTVYAELGKLRHQPEGKGLPADFADQFFRHEPRRNKKQTVEAVRARIAALMAELEKETAALAALEAKAKGAEEAEQARKGLEAELAAAEQARAELEKKTAEIKAKLKR
ncbi:hypothetical protein [Polyangium sp. 15x6]|uniref:hypothetical protein n=1 Tax=Polyangium sp. 15x6 TaxID=3042687 RepID=UPI00249A365D|nr:hypothetical protein [Polyangium sp. 15x6]MDI3286864.1 hypothetical protein [Polyangium sp. 15x6]